MLVVAEADWDAHQLAAALDVDLLRAVHQDVGDRLVAEERLDWTETGYLIDDLLDHLFAFGLTQRCRFAAQELRDRGADLRDEDLLVRDALEGLEIEPLDESTVQVDLELVDGTECLDLDPAG